MRDACRGCSGYQIALRHHGGEGVVREGWKVKGGERKLKESARHRVNTGPSRAETRN